MACIPFFAVAGETGGCLGASAQACDAWMKQFGEVQDGDLGAQLDALNRRDVNGKAVGGDIVLMRIKLNQPLANSNVLLRMSKGSLVNRVEVPLPSSPRGAQTEDEYARTAIFEAAQIALGPGCPQLIGPLPFYRFFESRLKPRLKYGHHIDVDMGGAREETTYTSPKVAFCGRTVRFLELRAYDTGDISDSNWHGYTFSSMLTFE